jgi:formylmethanofuran dehydrogenase subunit C
MVVKLRLRKELRVPVDGKPITPDVFVGKSIEEITQLRLWEGNRKILLSNLFAIEGSTNGNLDGTIIHLEGNLSKINRIGFGMTGGEILIDGDTGMHLGSEMKGGKITVRGNASSWLGASMKGGTIEVRGNAGDYVGAPYRGSDKGMNGGTILIHGNAGTEVGNYMRNGFIQIDGDVKQFVGIHQKKGIIFVGGDAESRAGAFMTGGKIIVRGHLESLLPTFTIDSIKKKAKTENKVIQEPFFLFLGDLAEHGNGKLYVSINKNEQLKERKKFLE